MQTFLYILLLSLFTTTLLHAQHDHHAHQKQKSAIDSTSGSKAQSDELSHNPVFSEGSGSSWMPESSVVPMKMFQLGEWMAMIHGSVSLRFTRQGGPRGESAFSAPNWFMASVRRPTSDNGTLIFRSMLSLDRFTEGGDGYPLLLQSGESWKGEHLVDRQHPHDFFSELSALYNHRLTKGLSAFVYLGYPGEPALGPPAFMHRASAGFNPDAPISHHWQDATHVSFGVLTGGLVWDRLKLELSAFNGREPNEERFGFDTPRFTSRSIRFTVNPVRQLSMQASVGALRDPENNGVDVTRSSASLMYAQALSGAGYFESAVIWGQNNDSHTGVTGSLVLEASLYFSKYAVHGRAEMVDKIRHELSISENPEGKERIRQFSLGLSRSLIDIAGMNARIGAQGTLYTLSPDMQKYYGANPVSFQLYLTISPASSLQKAAQE
ncbi:MAG: hypothetical protein M5R41_13870 [Bacteroidia bacterium]|nr:hypothetical protein [Bacteroidia bacterium]